jgi:probable DNA repair protein
MINPDALPAISFAQLNKLSAAQTTILTVNNRLARRLVQEFARSFSAQSVVEMPVVVPFSAWIAQQLAQAGFQDTLRPHAYLLDAFGSQLLWAQVIDALEATEPLLDTQQAANAAQQADKLLDEWTIEVRPEIETEEYARFIQWRGSYQQRLEQLNALDPNLAIDRVIEHIRDGLPVTSNLVLAGFSELTPRMRMLLEALSLRDVSMMRLEQEAPVQAKLSRVLSDTSQTEWESAAYWARSKLAQQPQGRFAIVSISLEADAALARRTLSRVLEPDGLTYNVAIARSLADWQAGRAVLAWLRTFVLLKERGRASASDLGAALLSGYCVGDLNELGARASIDARWRHDEVIDLSLQGWSKAIQELEQLSPAWHLAWQTFSELSRKDSLRRWSSIFRQTLAIIGFPGRTRQSSTIYQVVEALDEIFEKFEALSPITEPLTATQALNIFARLMRSVSFQPQRDPNARLDVLGMLEAEGGRWDAVWVLGLTDEVFPAAARPNPFIPLSALRQAGAPRATPEREREWAEQMFSHLCILAPEVVVSSAMHEGERGLRPSALIQGIALAQQSLAQPDSFPTPSELESIEDNQAPPLGPADEIGGGVALLETQARNPQWAFVRYRLGARALPAYSTMPSTIARGEFLHDAIEVVWRELRTQEALKASCANDEINALIMRGVNLAADSRLRAMRPALRALEVKRACAIISSWLAIECERLPFVVEDIEERYDMTLSGMTLKIRLDRMDQLHDGSRVVIDYKGGRKLSDVVANWRRARPTSLQLPAYAAVLAQQGEIDSLAGLMLVHLHANATPPVGLLRDDIGVAGPKLFMDAAYPDPDWVAAIKRLNNVVENLAAEFSSGVADNISWSKSDLEYCDVPALLRVYDDALSVEEDVEVGESGSIGERNDI